MHVYRPQDRNVPRHAVLVQPGKEFPTSEWLDEDGRPRMFRIEFVAGCAEVADNLGAYMIDHEIAQRSPLLLPKGAGLRG
ncbi:hypothetical protein WL95_27570 [Burkholderia cepacia]|nr:hypothetical protein WL95_27570 [Burkholderia cepacia]